MRLVYLCTCLLLGLAEAEHGVSLTQTFGSFQSPNFPATYPDNTRHRWDIRVPDGFRVRLDFSHFDLEPSDMCQCDYIRVEDGGGASDVGGSSIMGVFCGGKSQDPDSAPGPEPLGASGNIVSVVFSSDFSNQQNFSGFEAHYSAVDVDECVEGVDENDACDHLCHNYVGGFYCSCRLGYLLHHDKRTCTVECSGLVFSERAGSLSSPDFPSPYPKRTECSYVIQVSPGLKLRLHFDDPFDVEDHPQTVCPYDYIKIRAASKEFGPFCGGKSPGVIQTDSNIVAILFHSDHSGENVGWRMTYTSEERQCTSPVHGANATVIPLQPEYSAGDRVRVSCLPGFMLIKDGERMDADFEMHCQQDGTWDTALPVCQSKSEYGCSPDVPRGAELPSCMHACGRPSRPLAVQVKRIVGGRAAEPGNFPWQVLLSVEDSSRVPSERWFGSGALLSDTWILTAAHVVRSRRRGTLVVPVAPDHIKVLAGTVDVRDKRASALLAVSRVLVHPDFCPSDFDNDIALLKLSTRAELNRVVRPVCLPLPPQSDISAPPPGSLGVVAGWGVSHPDTTSDLLQFVRLPVVPQDECRDSYAARAGSYNVSDNMFCAGFYEGGRDTCLGDSGGAFVAQDPVSRQWAVFGLVSWAGPEECGSRRVYGVYTRVNKYLKWIQRHLAVVP
ncbi:mannan-binding lectin serine protease 1 isoform X2 [Hippocampus zosterae]|uniref:mannan-binding lectin serine protease 1 isoform X2 n=1 Tax=Hippocampus zosterae TaxID=109293 RepID=UPI00223E4D98|nr:mannan-binding lectin serine protease 1 isoform X2 [Hippocampus zosterae]